MQPLHMHSYINYKVETRREDFLHYCASIFNKLAGDENLIMNRFEQWAMVLTRMDIQLQRKLKPVTPTNFENFHTSL